MTYGAGEERVALLKNGWHITLVLESVDGVTFRAKDGFSPCMVYKVSDE